MRFFPNGPNIPDLLLEQRDKGRVVFLCGAGVSVGAGLPNFSELTGQVIEFFDPAQTSPLTEKYTWGNDGTFKESAPLDQIFQLLYQEFGRDEVRSIVARLLDRTPSEVSEEHQIISRLSADQERNPQIVTTNFDRLFEQIPVGKPLEFHTPPAFPDINVGVPVSGITYLHGRLQRESEGTHDYVLSSSDFGRAYLSEAWATRFMRSLLDQYTVVLVGYQAEDPPIKYLLQGLNHDGSFDRSRLYAFDRGSQEDVCDKWFDRGVTGIAFNDFPDLWQSLEAWAERADDPKLWRSRVVDMALRGPRELADYERGQVVHLVRTAAGARTFAKADPGPPAEWLCVFDSRYRVSKSGNTVTASEHYGLDDDETVVNENTEEGSGDGGVLEWCRGDFASHSTYDLARPWPEQWTELPPRLFNLARWIAEQANSPVCLWWMVRQNNVNPRLMEILKQKVSRDDDLNSEARRLWELFFLSASDDRGAAWSTRRGCFDLKDKIRRDGWSLSSLRLLQEVVAPILICEKPLPNDLPPLQTWDETSPSDIARWEVKFPEWHGEKLTIPDESLISTIEILEGSLRMAENLLEETKQIFCSNPTCYPNREVEGELREDHGTFYWFLELFDRLVALFPGNAIARSLLWPTEYSYYFRRLKAYSLNQPALFSAPESYEVLPAFVSSGIFWEHDICREVLFYLGDRWDDFTSEQRTEVAQLLLQGPDEVRGDENRYASRLEKDRGLLYLQWLLLQGKALPKIILKSFRRKIAEIPDWDETFAENLTNYDGLLAINVEADESTESLSDLPINAITDRAISMQRADYFSGLDPRPFDGLVKENPRKALAALSHASKNGNYPKLLWAALLRHWPEAASLRLTGVLAERLARLPENFVVEIKDPFARWLEKWFGFGFRSSEDRMLRVFDHLMHGILEAAQNQDDPGVGHNTDRIKSPHSHATNHPVGILAQTLVRFVSSRERLEKGGIHEEFSERLELLLDAPAKSGESAAAVLAHSISQLYLLSPAWVFQHLMPRMKFEHPHSSASWHGFLSSAHIPNSDLMMRLKPTFQDLFPRIYAWHWEDGATRIASQMVVALAIKRSGGEALLQPKEARHCIRNMTNQNRKDAVEHLRRVGVESEGAWSTSVIPFIENVWPRDVRLKTATLTMAWVSLLERTGDSFLLTLRTLRKFLVPVERESHWLYSFSRAARGAPVTMKYPEGVLELLALLFSRHTRRAPYELAQILDLIEEASSELAGDGRFLRLQGLVEST